MSAMGAIYLGFAIFGGLSSRIYTLPKRRASDKWYYFCWRIVESREVWTLLMVAIMYAYHVAILLKIRSANQFDLIGGKETEIRTFGQIIAIVMLLLVFIQMDMALFDNSSDNTCGYCGHKKQPQAREPQEREPLV
ncbi:hypothetical protein K491DRAFT_723339 [Lophiostoma macrostomum CBS 122681]|uniref:Uncharacterized protein n=1 Tax=Lophiostoma macrostomum CBS 122681 TaxID=1314788 RepID=A0A6A6SIZ6_9PLEO|nr:hypothetical protein K491DRAFT_723339 [Lophiostoma macrostomum CBS 122681]